MINLGTCTAEEFDANRALAVERFHALYGSDTSSHVSGTISQAQKPCAVMSYNPPSWWTARGSHAKRRQMENRGLPSFKGWAFVTFTLNRDPSKDGFDDPEHGYEAGKEKLRRTIYRLRNDFGYEFEKYCWKLEFHKPDSQGRIYPHWHLLLKCRAFMKKEHLEAAWGLGHADARRVKNDRSLEGKGFGYVFKYCAKTIETIPDYVLDSDKRLRAWQTSPNFYKDSRTRTGSKTKKARASLRPVESVARSANTQNAAEPSCGSTSGEKSEAATGAGSLFKRNVRAATAEYSRPSRENFTVKTRVRSTLRDRLDRWQRSCVVISETADGKRRFRAFPLTCEWSRVPLNFWSYAAKSRPDLMKSDDFSVSGSSVRFPDDELFLRIPIAFAADRREVEVQAVAQDNDPF